MISIVIPCYNEEEMLSGLSARITEASRDWSEPYEVVAVDDGSKDSTWARLEELAATNPHWKILRFGRNFGHQVAISAGIFHASGDAVVTMDADLQDPPEEIKRFLEKWREGYDVVYGIRKARKEGFIKRFLYHFFYRVLSFLADTEIPKDCGDFSLIDRRVADELNRMSEKHRFIRGLRAWIGLNQIGVEYERAARFAGDPKYGFSSLFRLAFNGIFSFSVVPLRVLTYTGALISFLTLVGAAVYMYRRLTTDTPVAGFATLVIVVLFLGGVHLIGLGMIGEYVGRIYEEVKKRPLWIIQQKAGFSGDDEPSGTDAPGPFTAGDRC